MDTARLIEGLMRPDAYPGAAHDVGFLETHISLLFFAGNRVYKVKKPVNLGFLDYTTIARRRHFCDEEVRLNRRLAPSVYLGVVPIASTADGRLCVNGAGEIVDWAVEMVRLPEQRMLASLLDRGEIDNEKLNVLIALLVEFNAGAPTGPGVDEFGAPEAVAANAAQNFDEIESFTGTVGSAPTPVITAAQRSFLMAKSQDFLASHRALLERRVAEGRIRDGHGDLHAGNICFTEDGPIAYDCIEFSRRFRCADVAADLAFLAMDLDARGYPGFSSYLLKRYADVAHDADFETMARFYKGYRAVIRGKVAAITSRDAKRPANARGDLRRESMRYFHLAAGYELPPCWILMCGLPASGKSHFAHHLAHTLRALLYRSDVRRKSLAGVAATTHVRDEHGEAMYSMESKERVYRSLLADAIESAREGRSAIVDAAFSRRTFRTPFLEAASRHGIPCFLVHVSAPEAVIRERMAQRAKDRAEVSDADLGVYLRERERFEPPTEVDARRRIDVVSGACSSEEHASQVIDRMIAAARVHDSG